MADKSIGTPKILGRKETIELIKKTEKELFGIESVPDETKRISRIARRGDRQEFPNAND